MPSCGLQVVVCFLHGTFFFCYGTVPLFIPAARICSVRKYSMVPVDAEAVFPLDTAPKQLSLSSLLLSPRLFSARIPKRYPQPS